MALTLSNKSHVLNTWSTIRKDVMNNHLYFSTSDNQSILFNREILCALSPFLSDLIKGTCACVGNCCITNYENTISLPDVNSKTIYDFKTLMINGTVNGLSSQSLEELKSLHNLLGFQSLIVKEEVDDELTVVHEYRIEDDKTDEDDGYGGHDGDNEDGGYGGDNGGDGHGGDIGDGHGGDIGGDGHGGDIGGDGHGGDIGDGHDGHNGDNGGQDGLGGDNGGGGHGGDIEGDGHNGDNEEVGYGGHGGDNEGEEAIKDDRSLQIETGIDGHIQTSSDKNDGDVDMSDRENDADEANICESGGNYDDEEITRGSKKLKMNCNVVLVKLREVDHFEVMRSPTKGKFTNRDDLYRHVSRDAQDSEKPYICDLCKKFRGKYRATVLIHVESQHFPGVFKYPCDICGRDCQSKQQLHNHKHTHMK